MKKLLLPFEGSNYPKETLEFAHRLNELSPILLTGIFVPEIDYANLWNIAGGAATGVYIPQIEREDEAIEENKALLEAYCKEQGIKYVLRTDNLNFALPSIRDETRFADLLALSTPHFFEHISSDQPNAYMKELLHSTECPILLLPDNPYLPDNIVLTYDGTASAAYAIKQFAYLFPELSAIPTTLVFINDNPDESFPDATAIEELAAQHFSALQLLKLGMRPAQFFNTWIRNKEHPWLVAGSYGRSEISLLFSRSFINGMIRKHQIPLFISHC